MADWFDHRRYSLFVDPHLYPMFDVSHPLVLCHMDLNMRNIIVDRRGEMCFNRLWHRRRVPSVARLCKHDFVCKSGQKGSSFAQIMDAFCVVYHWYETEYLHRLEPFFSRPWLHHPKGYFERSGLDITYRCVHLRNSVLTYASSISMPLFSFTHWLLRMYIYRIPDTAD